MFDQTNDFSGDIKMQSCSLLLKTSFGVLRVSNVIAKNFSALILLGNYGRS